MKYDFSKLWAAQFFGFYEFKDFYEYASDKESQICYYKRLGAIRGDLSGVSKIETPKDLIECKMNSNRSTLRMITNQLIVFLFTRYEFLVQNAMKCLICDDSTRILKLTKVYPDYKDTIGFSLKEFVEYQSKEEYVTIIGDRLSTRILNGKPSNVLKRIRCILEFEDIDTFSLDQLMVKRNNIVHEGQVYEIGLEELESYYEVIENLLKVMARALKKINIHIICFLELYYV